MSTTVTLQDNTPNLIVTLQTGADGRNIELRTNAGQIEWRYVGDTAWTLLVTLADLTVSGSVAWTSITGKPTLIQDGDVIDGGTY